MPLSLKLKTPSGTATYHIIGEQGFHGVNELTVEQWSHCVILSYADGASSFNSNPYLATRFELRGADWIACPKYPLGQTVLPYFYAYIMKQKGWEKASLIPDALPPPTLTQAEDDAVQLGEG